MGESFTPERQGYWEGQESEAGASGCCNPYAGVVLLVPEQGTVGGKKVIIVTVCLLLLSSWPLED